MIATEIELDSKAILRFYPDFLDKARIHVSLQQKREEKWTDLGSCKANELETLIKMFG